MTIAPQRPQPHSDTAQPSVELLGPLRVEPWSREAEASRLLSALLLTFQLQGRLVGLIAAQGRAFELTASETLALVVIGRSPTAVSGIGRAVGIRPNGASVLVDRLNERELVRRQRSRRDNRIVTVDLTDAGRELANILTDRVAEAATLAFGSMKPQEQSALVASLQQLCQGRAAA